MLNNPLSYPITSSMTVHRMRYRGPMESYKLNKFSSDIAKDISILESHIHTIRNDLEKYIDHSINGCADQITIGEGGSDLFTGACTVTIEEFNNRKNNNLYISKEVTP